MNAVTHELKAAVPQASGLPRLLDHFAPDRRALWGVGVLSGVVNLLMLTAPLFMLQVYDRVIPSGSMATLTTLFALVAVLYAAQAVIDYSRGRVMARLAEDLDARLVDPLFRKDVGRAATAPGTAKSPLDDLSVLRRFLAGPAPLALLDAPWIPVYLFVLASLHWILGVLGLFGALLVVALAVSADLATRSEHRKSADHDTSARRLQTTVGRAAEAALALGMRDRLSDRYGRLREEGIAAEAGGGDVGARFSSASKGFRLFLQSATLAAGAALAIGGEVSAGAIVAASIILGRALAPIDQIVGQWRSISQARAAAAAIAGDIGDIEQSPHPIRLPAPLGFVQVEGLSAAPPGSRRAALSGVSFELSPGDGLGIIGPSASGKSTLARALVGIAPALAGEIRLDGATLDQWTPEELGRYVGYLPQDVELLDGTVQECIARHDPDARDDYVLRAAEAAGAHEMILTLPQGYATKIGEGGTGLSGGQRQRIALARALYGDPVLIVLDEPNANLDQDGDAALTHALHNARARGATVVIVTHKPAAVAAVDRILVLKDGMQAGFDRRDVILRQVLRVAEGGNGVRSASR